MISISDILQYLSIKNICKSKGFIPYSQIKSRKSVCLSLFLFEKTLNIPPYQLKILVCAELVSRSVSFKQGIGEGFFPDFPSYTGKSFLAKEGKLSCQG